MSEENINKKSSKTNKSKKTSKKGIQKIIEQKVENNNFSNIETPEKKYDINMTVVDENTIKMEMKKKQHQQDLEDGDKALKEILKPKISESFQEEINKLDDLIKLFKNHPIPDEEQEKDKTIAHLKNVINILMQQSQNLIKEMKLMSRKNSYLKNNVMLASFILDKCRKEVPETEEEFEKMFN
jgi:hypothetical protein